MPYESYESLTTPTHVLSFIEVSRPPASQRPATARLRCLCRTSAWPVPRNSPVVITPRGRLKEGRRLGAFWVRNCVRGAPASATLEALKLPMLRRSWPRRTMSDFWNMSVFLRILLKCKELLQLAGAEARVGMVQAVGGKLCSAAAFVRPLRNYRSPTCEAGGVAEEFSPPKIHHPDRSTI